MSEQVDTSHKEAVDFVINATQSYSRHFTDARQAATDDVLGQCLEALQSCANVMQHMINDGDGTNCPYDELEEVNRILAMTGGEK